MIPQNILLICVLALEGNALVLEEFNSMFSIINISYLKYMADLNSSFLIVKSETIVTF